MLSCCYLLLYLGKQVAQLARSADFLPYKRFQTRFAPGKNSPAAKSIWKVSGKFSLVRVEE